MAPHLADIHNDSTSKANLLPLEEWPELKNGSKTKAMRLDRLIKCYTVDNDLKYGDGEDEETEDAVDRERGNEQICAPKAEMCEKLKQRFAAREEKARTRKDNSPGPGPGP